VKVNGRVIWKAGKVEGGSASVRFKEATSRYLMFTVEPGTWSFSAQKTGK
jgi:hypothetical protein